MNLSKILMLSVFSLGLCAEPSTGYDDRIGFLRTQLESKSGDYVIVVAHRGCWRDAPENSLKSIETCISLGADMVEVDVNRTKDGGLVVIHDDTVNRTTSAVGAITEMSQKEATQLRLKNRDGSEASVLTDERLPTWRDVLGIARGKILINLDAKGDVRDQALAEAIELGVEDQIVSKIGVSSADDPKLRNAAFWRFGYFMPLLRQCTEYRLTNELDCTPVLSSAVPKYQPYSPVAYEVTYVSEEYLREGIAAMRERGRVWVNTLSLDHAAGIIDSQAVGNPEETWGHLIDLGVNMIQTDEPEALLKYLHQRGLHEKDAGDPTNDGAQ